MADRLAHRQQRNSGTLLLLVQIAHPAIWFVTRLYRIADLVFGLDRRGAASNLKRLIKEVESECDYLFSKYDARIVPELSHGMPSFDWATVVVEVRSLQLSASRDRGPITWGDYGSLFSLFLATARGGVSTICA
jgi:hypothetical protein